MMRTPAGLPTRHTPHEVWEDGQARGIRIGEWSIETRKRAILNAAEIDEAAESLSIPLPEITFGNNLVSLRRKDKGKGRADASSQDSSSAEEESSFEIKFDGLAALAQVDATGEDNIKVAYADKWAQSRNLDGQGQSEVIETVKNFDWTYTTSYAGSVAASTSSSNTLDSPFRQAPPGHPGIPLGKLAKQDEPILFYDDVMLFEDELHDNGIANLNIKIRVMPSSFFLLSRFFLRVDNVLFRIFDVRIYHDFSTNEIIRETKGKEASYDTLRQRLPRERADDLTPLTDSNWVANQLGMLKQSSAEAATSTARPPIPASTGAPWAASATASPSSPSLASDRRQIAPGVSLPQRMPQMPIAAPLPQSAAPSTATPASGKSEGHGAGKRWKGLGDRLEVASL